MNKLSVKNLVSIGVLLLLAGFVIAGCSTSASTAKPAEATSKPVEPATAVPATTAPEATTAPKVEGDPIRGGLLYDEWWAVLEVDVPEGDQALWSTQSTNKRSGADTWRCKECHGWDYKGVDGAYGSGSHATGFVGVFASKDKPASEVVAALKGSTNPGHDFSAYLDDTSLNDLAVFITQALIDETGFINPDKSSTGNAAAGQTGYEEVCIKCHGPKGNAINFASIEEPEFLGHLAPDNPWEFFHKVRFGQPGWPMPSSISNDWVNEDVANLLAYVQTFTTDPALSDGAKLYDNWWKTLGLEAPENDQPLWATQSTNTRSGADTWRCKECHGWDYKGAEGVYGAGSHATGFPGILSTASMSVDEIVSWLNGAANPDHDFSSGLNEFAQQAMAKFIQTEMADSSPFINADGTVKGDPANGRELFEGTCVACHGVDGKKINFGSADEPEYVGTVAADNPWEFFHKASFGQPGEPMPAGRALGWDLQQIADILAYAQTLPTK